MKKINRINLSAIFFWFVAISIVGFISPAAYSQVDCTITSELTMPVCQGVAVTLNVAEAENLIYEWSPSGDTTSSINLIADATISYSVKVTDTISGEVCNSAPFDIQVFTPFEVNFEQLQLTCTNGDNDNGNTAMLKATASGESGPYIYSWDVRPIQIAPGNPSLAIGLKAHLWYFIDVTDINGCVRSDSVFTKAFYNPRVDIISTPDTAFIQKPYVQYEFENLSSDSISIESNYWEFGDESERSDLPNPLHIYTEVGDYTVFLTVFNSQGCDTIFSKVTKVLPVKLKIPNVITPNGDNINDVLIITEAPAETETEQMFKSTLSGGIRPLSAYYKKTSLVIFNRQGSKVYESINYDNDWGGSGLADGVYFYVLQCEGFKSNDVYRGSITIIASGN